MLLVLSIALLLVTSGMSYKAGAPQGRCTSMMPGHGPPAQTSESPYSIEVKEMAGNEPKYMVKVVAKDGTAPAIGLLMQAREEGSTTPVGTFMIPAASAKYSQHLTCSNDMDAVTHTNETQTLKGGSTTRRKRAHVDTAFMHYWLPGNATVNKTNIVATVVQTQPVFWMNVKAPVVGHYEATTAANNGGNTGDNTGDNTGASSTMYASSVLVLLSAFYAMLS